MKARWAVPMIVLVSAVGVHADTAAPLELKVTMPARIVDGDPLFAESTLVNMSTRVLNVTRDEHAIEIAIRPLETRTKKLFVKQERSSLSPQLADQRLAPAEQFLIRTNVLDSYPLGLSPGTYEILARYTVFPSTAGASWHGTISSKPVLLEILPQDNDAYREFLAVSAELLNGICEQSVSRAVAFARDNPHFTYTGPMLVSLMYRVPEKDALTIADLIVSSNFGSSSAAAAQHEIERIERVSKDRAARQQYYDQIAREAADPVNARVRDAVEALGSITQGSDFHRYEAFLKLYPKSYFSAEARWQTITAVEDGILPSGETDRDAVLARYYSDMISRYGESYWGARAAHQSGVRDLLKRQSGPK